MMTPKEPRTGLSLTLKFKNYQWIMESAIKKGIKPSHFMDRIIEERIKLELKPVDCVKCGRGDLEPGTNLCFGCLTKEAKNNKVTDKDVDNILGA